MAGGEFIITVRNCVRDPSTDRPVIDCDIIAPQSLPLDVYIAFSRLFQSVKSFPHRLAFFLVSFLVKAQNPKISPVVGYDLWIDDKVESL